MRNDLHAAAMADKIIGIVIGETNGGPAVNAGTKGLVNPNFIEADYQQNLINEVDMIKLKSSINLYREDTSNRTSGDLRNNLCKILKLDTHMAKQLLRAFDLAVEKDLPQASPQR